MYIHFFFFINLIPSDLKTEIQTDPKLYYFFTKYLGSVRNKLNIFGEVFSYFFPVCLVSLKQLPGNRWYTKSVFQLISVIFMSSLTLQIHISKVNYCELALHFPATW